MFNGGAVVYTYTDPTRPGRRQTLPETIHPAILLWGTERCRSLLCTRAADYMGAVAPTAKKTIKLLLFSPTRAFYSRGNEADCLLNEPGDENPLPRDNDLR